MCQSVFGRRVRIRGKIMIIRTSTVLSVALLIAAFAGGLPGAAGEWATKEDAIAMVQHAMAFITQHGPEKAYAEITKKTKRFHDRGLYITVVDLEGKVLAHGQSRDLIGKNLINAKDPDGKLFIKERIELAHEQSAFWHNYKWLNPTTKEIEPQETYCERLNDTVVCGAVYSF
jgi:cytochrome c